MTCYGIVHMSDARIAAHTFDVTGTHVGTIVHGVVTKDVSVKASGPSRTQKLFVIRTVVTVAMTSAMLNDAANE
jgi:hypothetical protein